MLSKLSYLNSNIALTLGYLNPALNNSALVATEEVQWKIRLSDYEMLFIKEKKPSLNTQSVSILAKLFVTYFHLHVQTCYFLLSCLFCHFKPYIYQVSFQFLSLSLDNDVIVTSKRCVNLFSPNCIRKCLTKFNLIRKLFYDKENYASMQICRLPLSLKYLTRTDGQFPGKLARVAVWTLQQLQRPV